MLTAEQAHHLWRRWSVVLCLSIVFYSLLYLHAFRRQRSRSTSALPYTPLNCSKYASCVLSTINAIILSVGGPTAVYYHRYLNDPLYGTPGIAFYVHATFLGYLTVDAVAIIIVHCTYRLKALMWDVILHHLLFIICCLWQQIPLPHYAWITACAAYIMEVSTIFLNGNFMAKWYKCSESVIFRFKLGFLISWFLVRVPVTFVFFPGYWILYGKRVWLEFPIDKAMAIIVLPAANLVMQSIWTLHITKKAYKTLMKKKDHSPKIDNFDLDFQQYDKGLEGKED